MSYALMIIPLSISLIVLKFDCTHRKLYFLLTFLPTTMPWLAYAALLNGDFADFQRHDTISLTISNIRLLFIVTLSQISALYFLNGRVKRFKFSGNIRFSVLQLTSMYAIVAVIILITISSYIRAGGFENLLIDPRKYEATFGKYRVLNYIYFSIPLFCILLYEQYNNKKRKFDLALIMILLGCSTLFGNKTSFIDSFLIFVFYIYCNRRGIIAPFIYAAIGMITVMTFFEFVRGGGFVGFVEYIVQGSINLHHFININNFVYADPLSLLIRIPIYHDYLNDSMPLGFILNDKHNTATAFYNLWSVGREPLIFLTYFFIYFALLKFEPGNIETKLAFACYFPVIFYMFFSYRLFMIKIVYLVILSLLAGSVLRKNVAISR